MAKRSSLRHGGTVLAGDLIQSWMPLKLGGIKRCPMGIHEPVHYSADCL